MTLRSRSIYAFAVILLCTNALEAKTVTLTSRTIEPMSP
jgi:hypothetical protein